MERKEKKEIEEVVPVKKTMAKKAVVKKKSVVLEAAEELLEVKEEPVVVPVPVVVPIVDARIWYRKEGGGSAKLFIAGRKVMIKPGQKFKALPDEIPVNFRDNILPMDAEQANRAKEVSSVKGVSPTFDVRQATKEGEFHVVNKSGNIITDDPMSLDEAKKLIKELER